MFLDTQKITHEIRMKHWMQIIAQRQQSGLTVKEFCAQQDIPIKQYYYWQHKLRIRFAPAQAPETKKEEVPTLVPLSAAILVQDSLIVQCGAFSLEDGCRPCRKQGQPAILKTAMPQPVIPHSIASPSVVAHVMMQKYGYALPLYRLESEWKRIGLAFSRANLANWIIIASKEWLAPVYGRMHEMLLEERCLHADAPPLGAQRKRP